MFKTRFQKILLVGFFLGTVSIFLYVVFINPPAIMCWDGVDELGNMIGGCEPDLISNLQIGGIYFLAWLVFNVVIYTASIIVKKSKVNK